MTEDKNGVKNGEANTEMAPQEDGTKVPLTDNECPEVRENGSLCPFQGHCGGPFSVWAGKIILLLLILSSCLIGE